MPPSSDGVVLLTLARPLEMLVASLAVSLAGVDLAAAGNRGRVGHAGRRIGRHVDRQRQGRIAGRRRPAASLRVAVSVARFTVQPVPLMAVAVRPAGSVSITFTAPLVGAKPALAHGDRVRVADVALLGIAAWLSRDRQVGPVRSSSRRWPCRWRCWFRRRRRPWPCWSRGRRIGGDVDRHRQGRIAAAGGQRVAARGRQRRRLTVQPEPVMAVAVRPPGSVSTTVTVRWS